MRSDNKRIGGNRRIIMQGRNKINNNNWSVYVDNVSKILTALIAAGGFVWGIIAFQYEQRTNETLEFRRKLWEKRLETYNKLSDVIGELIIKRSDQQAFDSLQNRFEFLYYSAMVVVEDSLVEQKMVSFLTAINDFKLRRKSEIHLKTKALQLMRDISTSLKKKQDLLYD